MDLTEDSTAPERNQVYHFLVVEDAETKRTILLEATTYSIGRNPTNGIVLHSQSVSRQHAILLRVPIPEASSHMFRIIDGNLQGRRSTNGIFINGKRRFSHILCHGDEIIFSSDTKATYHAVTNPAELLANDDSIGEDNTESTKVEEAYLPNSTAMSDLDLARYNEEVLSRLASIPELNPNPILEVNLQGAVTYLNPAALQHFPDLRELGTLHPALSDLLSAIKRLQGGNQEFCVREFNLGERTYEQFIHYISSSDLIRTYVADITERKRSQEIIRYQACHDPLTGLPNRTYFNEHLSSALVHAKTTGESIAVVFLDLDRFKVINDSLGHNAGDRLLQNVCERIKKYLRTQDIIARWGGDEFTLILREVTSAEHTVKLCQIILKAFTEPFICNDHELYMSTSMGISLYPFDGEDVETLVKNADIAMYRAKESGRNNCQLYTPSMNERAFQKLALENNLCKALERDELVIYYQPQVNLVAGQVIGAEALLRWQHPTLGLLSPDEFIPLAEETRLIIPIGYWLLRKACNQTKAWQAAGLPPLRLGVNLSVHQFKQDDFVKNLAEILEETQLEPQFLDLELTESIVMENVEENISKLYELRSMGINLSIDDFGTGYSSLSYLKSLPINVLKIHQSFVRDITNNPNDLAIAISIITLAHNLKLKVIAEGVETIEQMELLRSLKCDEMQGYLFNKPIPPLELAQLLMDQKCFW